MYDEAAVYAPDPADLFYQRLSETSERPGKPFYMPNGTPFFCTADGTLLRGGLADWEKLPEASRKPGAVKVPEPRIDPELVKKDRRLIRPPAGTLVLRAYRRGLVADEQGLLVGPRLIPRMYNIPAEPNRDFVWLQEAEWRSLIPADPTPGKSRQVPDAVRDRLCFWHIAGGYHCLGGYYTADSFESREMSLTVEGETTRQVTLRLRGSAVVRKGGSYRFHGVLEYDLSKRSFTRFDLVALCDEGHDPTPIPQNVAPFRNYGIAFELSGRRTDDLLPPFCARENGGTLQRYFGNTRR